MATGENEFCWSPFTRNENEMMVHDRECTCNAGKSQIINGGPSNLGFIFPFRLTCVKRKPMVALIEEETLRCWILHTKR